MCMLSKIKLYYMQLLHVCKTFTNMHCIQLNEVVLHSIAYQQLNVIQFHVLLHACNTIFTKRSFVCLACNIVLLIIATSYYY